MIPGALSKFNQVHRARRIRLLGRPPALNTRSLTKQLSTLRTEKRLIEKAIAVLERLAAGRAGEFAEADRPRLRLRLVVK